MVSNPLTKNIDMSRGRLDIAGYEAAGGYQSVTQIAKKLGADDVLEQVKDSGLKGRGGAGFPTGLKWSFVPMGDKAPAQKYLVVNADEMEPGTFKDRLLMEGDPHLLIEGMFIAAYTIQASVAYIFLRGEYIVSELALKKAIGEAYEKGYLGKNILNSGFDLDIILHTSAGRYICGEETALLNALEGKRANPRAKPPFPQVSGLWGKPTIVNNVETICNLPGIISYGVDWYHGLTKGADHGTKLCGVSGKVKNPGCWELPMGTPVRELLEGLAGGMRDGLELKGFLPGGGSTDFLLPEHLDLALDYDAIGKAGSRLGTGTMIILDDKTCPVGMVGNLIKFFAHESCGWCTPCREGLPWVNTILSEFEDGRGTEKDLAILHDHVDYLGPGRTFCALAPGAAAPLGSGLKHFKEDFERHIKDQRCSYKGV
ncbi:MAG: NADH-quinone oxidoreductase subunit NuoF [Gammaproteobacteria bacterium]|nr:NADH-quinone oxidoreductase subunit NuoF [Gammaproteobacteria bacterium]MDP7455146.1 NADH-quinone oxidoreductase subunit NuoF [Gammaproteobacteria bacterium]